MTRTPRTCTVDAPVETVWALLADFGAISSWAGNVDHSCILQTPDHADADDMVGATRRIQTGRTTLVERVTSWEPTASLAYDIEGLPPVLGRVSNRWDLLPDDPLATIVTLTTTVDTGARPHQRLVAAVASRLMARQSDVMLDGLRRRVQDGAQQHG